MHVFVGDEMILIHVLLAFARMSVPDGFKNCFIKSICVPELSVTKVAEYHVSC